MGGLELSHEKDDDDDDDDDDKWSKNFDKRPRRRGRTFHGERNLVRHGPGVLNYSFGSRPRSTDCQYF